MKRPYRIEEFPLPPPLPRVPGRPIPTGLLALSAIFSFLDPRAKVENDAILGRLLFDFPAKRLSFPREFSVGLWFGLFVCGYLFVYVMSLILCMRLFVCICMYVCVHVCLRLFIFISV